MIIFIIYTLTLLILFFVIFLAIRTIMKIRNISPYKEKNKEVSKIEVKDKDLIFKLKELEKMHKKGVINKSEFKLAKEKLLKSN
tara:strand:- start:387 stop:638 length:252 start_codon:yes stop_codon:yes gene_type:complete